MKRSQHQSCLTSLFRQNNKEISRTCSIQISTIEEKVLQLNTTTFLIYTKNEKQIFVTCTRNDEKIEKQFAISNLTYITMEKRCNALLEDDIITSNLPINFDIFQKITKIEINFNNVIGLETGEIAEFTKFLKTSLKNTGKPIKISDVKKLYHLKTLHTNSETIWSIFKKFFYACVTILLTLGLAMIIKWVWKCTRRTNKSPGKLHRIELRQIFKNNSEIVNEEGSNTGTDNHGSLSEQEKIIHFPS